MAAKNKSAKIRALAHASAIAGLVLALGACAPFGARDPNSPGWFKTRLKEAERQPFPKLAAVPELPKAPRPPGEWDAIATDVAQAGNVLAASPRSEPANLTPEEAAAFEEKARREVDGGRGAP